MVVKRDGFSIFGFSKGIIAPKHSCKKKNCTHFSFSRGCVQFTTGGEHRIRTCGRSHVNGFQDRRFKPLSQFSTFVFASVRKPLQRFAKTKRKVCIKFLLGQRVREVQELYDLFGTSPQDRRFKPLDGFPHLFLRRSENRCNGLPKQNARFVLSFCQITFD